MLIAVKGIKWREFGEDVYIRLQIQRFVFVFVYIRLASSNEETFLSVVFGNFDLICDILNRNHKLEFCCFVVRFIYIQRLGCDGKA